MARQPGLPDGVLGKVTDACADALDDAFDDSPLVLGGELGPVVVEGVGFDLHRGVIACAERRPHPSVGQLVGSARRIAVLEGRLAHVSNLSLRAKEWNGDLIFLHEAGPGPADRSYGVQVAKLAGVPMAVVARAREVLQRLESETASPVRLDDLPLFSAVAAPVTAPNAPSKVEADLRALDLDGMSPREAMDVLYRLRGLID